MNAFRKSSNKGFTLVEILIVVIILGILAAIVIPQFTNASEDARKSNMRSQLQTLRSQVELYKLQHRDVPPPATDADFWRVMTTKTNEAGVAPTGTEDTFGPYLQAKSVNPLTNSSTVSSTQGAAVGWVYANGTITGVNKAGIASDDGE